MYRLLGTFFAGFILVSGVLVSTPALAGSPREHIDASLIKFVAAFNAGDGAAVAALYTEDAALLPPGGTQVNGRAAIEEFWQGAIDSGMKIDSLGAVEVEANGDLAGEVGEFVLLVPGDEGTSEVAGKYIVIWKRHENNWQLHRDIWNTN